jgi:hypothetical protein
MENMREEARSLIELVRSKTPDDQRKALVMSYEQGMLMQKYIMDAAENQPQPPEKRTA